MRAGDIDPLLPAGYDVGWSIVVVATVAAHAALFLAALWSITSSGRLTVAGRTLWAFVVLGFPLLGALAWFAWGRRARLDSDLPGA